MGTLLSHTSLAQHPMSIQLLFTHCLLQMNREGAIPELERLLNSGLCAQYEEVHWR